MKLWIISSSLLILIIIGLRFLLKGRVSFRIQYAMWLIVLLRLLIPFSVGRSPVSVENMIPSSVPVTAAQPQQQAESNDLPPAAEFTIALSEQTDLQTALVDITFSQPIDLESLLQTVWMIGTGVIILSGVISNLLFQRKLRRSRTALSGCKTGLPVYLVQWLSTPCLAGLFRPSIYLTEEAAASPVRLRHVLAHEKMHYRHGDHFWAWMRLAALALHWYNPLVWVSAILSKRDAELACDEAVLHQLGDSERHAYGETLLSLSIPHVFRPFSLSTSMSESKKSLRERIVFIARSPHMKLSVLLVLILLCSAAVGITFPGSAKASFSEDSIQETLQNEDETVSIQSEFPLEVAVYSEETLSTPSGNNTVEKPAFPVLPDVPDAEQQYQLLMENRDKWSFEKTYPTSWWYTFTDLDHNGRMEVIADAITGSAGMTESHFYEVNENQTGILPLFTDQTYILEIQDEMTSYYDSVSNRYYYIDNGYAQDGAHHQYYSVFVFSYYNRSFDSICLGIKQIDYEGTDFEKPVITYRDGNAEPISETEYIAATENIFDGLVEGTLVLTWEKGWQQYWGDVLPEPTPDPMKVLEERPENIFPPSVLASAAAREASQSAPIVITYQPANATIAPGGETSFIAHADHATGICWRFISPEGQEYSLIETLKLHPGLSMNIHIYDKEILSMSTMPRSFTATDGDHLSMSNVPASLNGWGVKAVFYGPDTVAESSIAYLTVYEPVMVTDYFENITPTTDNSDTSEPDSLVISDASVNAYNNVIIAYKEILEGKSKENTYTSLQDLPSSHIGYALKDLDDNGVPELLLFAYTKQDSIQHTYLFNMYTLVNSVPTKIALYGMRRYSLCKDNTILYYVRAGEYFNFYTIQRLNGDKLEDVETTFEHSTRADDDRFYYQVGEVGTMPSDRSIHLSVEEYNSKLAEYRDLIYIPPLTRIY